MFLDQVSFSKVIESTPLVSIDLVVINTQGQALLGKRLNRPAKGFWFVPGGRILKDEALAAGFKRLTIDELGQAFTIDQVSLLGPFDHFYDDCIFGDDISTHYVAIAFVLKLECELDNLPLNVQHGRYKWFDISDLMVDDSVHPHTKWYFEKNKISLFKKD